MKIEFSFPNKTIDPLTLNKQAKEINTNNNLWREHNSLHKQMMEDNTEFNNNNNNNNLFNHHNIKDN